MSWSEYKQAHGVEEEPEVEVTEEEIDVNERLSNLEQAVRMILRGGSHSDTAPVVTDIPMEELQISGERVNYKLSLPVAIFSRYEKFKAVSQKRGHPWDGDLSTFIDLATKDALRVHGIYDSVLELRGNKWLVELPAELS